MADRLRTGLPDWNDVRFFLALVRAGSLSAASRDLRVNHATVGRRVTALEQALGQALFERRPDGYDLTGEGHRLLPTALAMEQSALAFAEAASTEAHAGTVRIATVRSLADAFLADRLIPLTRDYPSLCLEVVTDVRVVSLARREADVALRLGRPEDGSLTGRRLASVRYAFYAAPEFADRASRPEVPAIGFRADESAVVEAAWIEHRFADRRFAYRSDSNIAQARIAEAGGGVAMLPCYLGARYPGLVKVDIGPAHPPRELWLLSPRELARIPRVRLVLDAVGEVVARDRHLFE